MSIPYTTFPTFDTWHADSGVSGIFPSTWRSSDPTLGVIDEFVRHYNDVNFQDVQIETLFFLTNAINFWQAKLNKTPANRGEPLDAITGIGLPTTGKVTGNEQRRSAMSALKMIAGDLLMQNTNALSSVAAMAILEPLFIKASHGVGPVGQPGSDLWQINKVPVGELAVFLQQAYLQRRYKLRFRNGIAWRWDPATNANAVYDTTNNAESEGGIDRKTHFVMDTRGHIYAGFNRQAFWFKHSSLIGGANAFSAGRMIVEAGKVTHVENDSGHYQPGIKQMRNLLHRLRLYGRDIGNITVRRVQPGPAATFQGGEIATSKTTWPDGVVG